MRWDCVSVLHSGGVRRRNPGGVPGVGHGYGLSQYGAKCMAEEGKQRKRFLIIFIKNIVLIF